MHVGNDKLYIVPKIQQQKRFSTVHRILSSVYIYDIYKLYIFMYYI